MTQYLPDKKSIGHGAIWSTVNQSVSQFMVLAVFLVTARFVPKEDFGTMAVCLLLFEFFRQVIIESIGTTLLSKHTLQETDYNTGFLLANIGSALASLCLFALAVPMAILLDNPALEHGIRLTSLMLLALGLSKIHEVWLMRRMEFRSLALRSLIAISCGGLTGIYLAVHGYGLLSLIVQQIVTSVLGAIFLWAVVAWRPAFKTNKESIKSFIAFTKHVSMTSGFAAAGSQANIFFSSYYMGPVATGLLNAANRLIMAIQTMTTSGLNFVALPALSQYSQTDEALQNAYLKCVKYTAVLTFPLFAGFGILSHDIIKVLLGDKWLDAAMLLPFLVIPALIWSVDQYNSNILLIRNRPHWRTWLTIANALLNIAILIAVARFGLIYIVLAGVLRTFAIYPLTTTLALSLIGMGFSRVVKTLFPVVCATGCMLLCVGLGLFLLPLSGVLNLMVLVPLGGVSYFLFIFLFDKNFFFEIKGLILTLLNK